ncbi:ABC transporter ATP-binding protein [Erythrobacter sp. JK5]|uniref:ABC transporter ATP-binding protein n=1 Tax=Erythrobacter sp. JK5 TaxID=2829500 RepID=UPI002012BC68|nr:ABC transporter ATP-binding protein [Erythrobacter sp. JK5]
MRFLLGWASQFKGWLALISALSLVSSLAALALPWLAGRFLGGVIGEEAIDLHQTVMLLIAALIAMTAVTILVTILSEVASGQILAALRRETYDRLQSMPVGFHDRSRSGDLLALMVHEVDSLSSFLTSTLAMVPSMLMTAAGAVVLLFLIDPTMALVIPVLVPVFYIVMKLIGRRLRVLSQRLREAYVETVTIAESDMSMLPAIKAFATEQHHRSRFAEAVEETRRLSVAQARIVSFVGPIVALVAACAAIAILLGGSAGLESGAREPSELFAFLLYAALLTRPVGGLANTYGRFQVAKGTLARLETVFETPPEPGYAGTTRLARARGAIAFEDVGFSYPERDPVLEHLDLAIAPGEVVALTGSNGVGKSTVIRLLLRFYDPEVGRITLDGIDISELQVQDLRRQFGYVPQRPLLFDGSIAANIAFGESDPDPEAIERAARVAQAWDFVAKLPQGLATEIGDNGIRLSGGQRQRIALARALYRDPPIYILDEATSMYDLEGEAAFIEASIRGLENRTVILITHRPASLALADRVIHAGPDGFVAAEPAASGAA